MNRRFKAIVISGLALLLCFCIGGNAWACFTGRQWGIDQLTAKAVSVSLGKDTVQFIRQPDGSYTPPANCTMTLLQTNSDYWLQERHGRTFQFNHAGWATNIVDPYGQSATLGTIRAIGSPR